jgi:hypothetical protein
MAITRNAAGFHEQSAVSQISESGPVYWESAFTYTFENFFHPFVGELLSKLNRDSLPGMLDAKWQDSLKKDFFQALYNPSENNIVQVKFSPKEIDVSEQGPYANYNWELFFHIPLTVAVHLSKAQRFAEAQRWLHYIFDPTCNDQSIAPPNRFWKFLAFRRDKDPKQIDELLLLLSKPTADLTLDDQKLQAAILHGYDAIRNKPFQPHAVARTRHLAYQYCVVMKYLDNLIAWGDNLFQQDTVESINEATQRYVLAANLLGSRPQQVPPKSKVRPKTFAQLKAGLDPRGKALIELEGQFPFNFPQQPALQSPVNGNGVQANSTPLFGIGHTLYFCIPRNDKLLGYWDLVADRLFKIRHCMNIEGVVRPLALFDPPIDPGMLVKAVAAGIDIGSVFSGLNQPIGPVRCAIMIQKALELCGEVRSLGVALLSALEKGDAEHLSLVRQRHDIQIQQMSQEVRFLQWKSAQEATKSLLASRATILERLHYYQRLLGLPADQNAPAAIALDRRQLTEQNFDEAYSALVRQYDKALTLQKLPNFKLAGVSSPSQQSGAAGKWRLYLNSNENADLNQHAPDARNFRIAATANDAVAQVLALIPDFGINIHFWGLGGNSKIIGGSTFAAVAHIVSSALNTNAADQESRGASASKTGGFERRADDWMLQYNLAAHELMQIGRRQILTSLIAEQLAHHEYLNIQQQIKNAHADYGISPTFVQAVIGNTVSFSVWQNNYDCNGNIYPSNPSSFAVSWSSSNSTIAKMSGNVATAKSGGTVTINAQWNTYQTSSPIDPNCGPPLGPQDPKLPDPCACSSDLNHLSVSATRQVQVPTSLRMLSQGISTTRFPNPLANGCPPSMPFGMELAVRYQVMDQQNPLSPIVATMTLRENLLKRKVDGQDAAPDQIDVPVTASGTTDSNGAFKDDGVGACGTGAFGTATFTQELIIVSSNGTRYKVRTNLWALTGKSGCGNMNNSFLGDINVTVNCP